MAKFVIAKKDGKTTISELAAATAQREATVRIGLEWLAAGGHVAVIKEEDAVLCPLEVARGISTPRKNCMSRSKVCWKRLQRIGIMLQQQKTL